MRILLDACVPARLRKQLVSFEVRTAQEMGWGDLDDGPLLDAIGERFDILVTVDQGIPKQQQLSHRAFGVIVLRAPTNRLNDLLPLAKALRSAASRLQPGEFLELSA